MDRAADLTDIFSRLRVLERDTVEDRANMRNHITACIEANGDAKRFRKELRGYCVAILCALIGIIVAAKFHLV